MEKTQREDHASQEAPFELDVRLYVDAIRKRWMLVSALVVLCTAAGFFYASRQVKLYRARTSIVIETSTPRVLTGVQDVVPVGNGAWWANEAFFKTEHEIMRSRAVSERVAAVLDLRNDDAHNGLSLIAEKEAREEARSQLDAAGIVSGLFQVKPDLESRVVWIEVVHRDPAFAAKVSDAVAQAYVDTNLERRLDGTREARSWLAVQHQQLRQKLEASEDALHAFMMENNVLNASLESQRDEVTQRLRSFIGRLAEVEGSRIGLEGDVRLLEKLQEQPGLVDSLPEVQQAPVIAAYKKRAIELETQRKALSARYQALHPKMVALDEQIGLVQSRLNHELAAVVKAKERKLQNMTRSERGLRRAIAKEREREADMNRLALQHGRLKREVETNSALYEMVTARMKETDLTGMMRFNNVRVLDKAGVPAMPFSPNLRRSTILAFLLSVLLGVGAAIALELMDQTLKSASDIDVHLETPFLGVLPAIDGPSANGKVAELAALQRRDLYVLDNPKSSTAECSRAIRTNLLFMSPDRDLKMLAVTSAMPREGKTTAAIGMAITMAQAGSRTLLVDTDMRRPRLHRSFGVPNDVGISSVIVGGSALDDAVKQTEAENLELLVCGPLPPNPAELLHTQRFVDVLTEMREKYDRILFDTPPVGAVTDPVVLSTLVDGTVLVVKANATIRAQAKQALRALRDANARVLGCILNDVDLQSRTSGSYYASYYRYGSYYGERDGANS